MDGNLLNLVCLFVAIWLAETGEIVYNKNIKKTKEVRA